MKETADSHFEEEVKQSKTKVIVEEYEKLSSSLIFEIIRHDGEKELDRATVPLIFSALAAGLMISFSFYFRAVLSMYAGHSPWADAISGIGPGAFLSSSWEGFSFSRKIPLPP